MIQVWLRLVVCVGFSIVLFGACGFESSFQPTPVREATGLQRRAIIGGKPDIRHPEVGALTANKRTFCTGTLIASRVVLTAAHCIDAALRNGPFVALQFRIDMPDKNAKDGFTPKYFDFDRKLFKNHPKWNQKLSNGGDVGVGILTSKVTIVKPMPANFIPLSSNWVGRKPLFLGYGLIQSVPSAISPNRKYGVELPITVVRGDRFTHQTRGKSVCHGDSGGPAIVLLNGRMRVIGVNSYVNAARVPGTTRSTCSGSGTSMRTDTYTAFIQSVLTTYGDGPETCEKNDECGQCAQCNTAKKVCEVVKLKTNPANCKPCRSDSDCGGSVCYRFPDGFRCLQPCTSKSCCPENHYCAPLATQTGLQSLCMPFENACAALACKKDSDCGPGEFCENSFCLPQTVAREPKLCFLCTKNSDCGKGLCHGLPGQKRCTQACGKGDFCPPGYLCSQPFPGVEKQCIPENGACFFPCTFNSHCAPGQVCVKGICASKEGGAYGDSCGPNPCKEPLECATTISGKRCLAPCNHPAGFAGSSCRNGSQCEAGLNCFSLSSDLKLCLAACRSSADCASKGGGQCSSGVCYCFGDSQCAKGFVCNRNSDSLGACAPESQSRKCTQPFGCKTFKGNSFCVNTSKGNRTLGQPCDPLNQCRDGLVCLNTTDGGVCFEHCDNGQKCSLGGKCVAVGRGRNVCLCAGTNDCAKNRICRPYIQQGLSLFGLCEPQGLKNPCVGDRECPPGYLCRRGQCYTPAEAEKIPPDEPEPNPEPAPEPSSENLEEKVVEAEPSRQEEPKPSEKATKDAGSVDRAKPSPEVSLPEPQGKGCACDVSSSKHRAPLWCWLVIAFLFGAVQRRRMSR